MDKVLILKAIIFIYFLIYLFEKLQHWQSERLTQIKTLFNYLKSII